MSYARVVSITLLTIGLSVPIEAATATWDRNPEPDIVAYRLSYGTQSGVHNTSIALGNVVTAQFFPPPGQRYYVVVQAINAAGGISAKSDEFVFDAPGGTQNQAPVLTQPANQTSTQNSSVSLTLVASDPEGSAVTFSASGLPAGLTINPSSGVISGTVTTVGTSNVTATASDGALSASRTFTWTVTASGGGSTTVTLSPIDTTLNIDTTNYSTNTKLFTYTYPANRVANAILMKFDLSQIPANATIQSATLRLSLIEMDGNTTDPNYSVSLHQIINRNPDLALATGTRADGVNNWTPSSCCYQNIPLAQADISPARATTVINRTLGTKTWDAASLVQAWRSAPATNYGLLLNSDATKGSDRFRFFASMEHATVALRPSLQVVYTVSGTPGDTTPPVASITAPANNATVSGPSVTVSATASDAVGVVGVQFRLDGANLGAEDTTSPYSVVWNATTATSGSHVLTAVARDAAGNSTTATSITVTVTPTDTTPPAVSITAPGNNAAVSGASVAVSASASDAVGVVGVQFRLDGANLGAEDTSSPYSVVWNATTASSGNHVLTAVARDAAGNSTTSTPITVSVNNNRAPTLTQPANQTSAEGSAVTLSLVASDPDGNALTFSATGLPAGLGISTSSGLISGTPTYTSAGTFSITATVSDGSLSASRTFSWTVTNTNRPPVLTQPANQSSSPNTTVSLQLVASDPDGTAVTYQASGLPPLAAVNSSTGLISGQLTASSAGVHTVTVTVSDGALVDTKTFTWSVNDSDEPFTGDFDGDGRDDPATYRASTGEWRRWLSTNNFAAAAPIVWGGSTDIPVPADFDGDNRTDIAVYRPSTGTWHVLLSSTNNQSGLEVRWGNANDRPMALDYDNDGRADLALPRFGGMDILLSSTNYTTSVTVR
jgi:hypothetical protein